MFKQGNLNTNESRINKPLRARIHTGLHRFKKIGQILLNK